MMLSNNKRSEARRRSSKKVEARKREQLGFAIGTASYRLKTMLLFQLLQQTGRDICFRCSLKIDSEKELSLDHKIPWLDNSPDLFWNLENVAFSHKICNVRAARRSTQVPSLRKVGPAGTAWCAGHQAFLRTENFRKNSLHWNGLGYTCKRCTVRYPKKEPALPLGVFE